jgi:hypothetical protein
MVKDLRQLMGKVMRNERLEMVKLMVILMMEFGKVKH